MTDIRSDQSSEAVEGLSSIRDLDLLPRSLARSGELEFGLARTGTSQRLAVLSSGSSQPIADFDGELSDTQGGTLLLGPLSARNAAALRSHLPWLRPRTLGIRISAGFGDRLGLATPGHIRALRTVGGDIAPIFAQQSIREMERTRRTAQQVLDDAAWGAFAEGWREGYGADADHLKTPADIDLCVAAGYTFFTFDPGAHVDNQAETMDLPSLRSAVDDLPWEALGDDRAALLSRYAGKTHDIEGFVIDFDEPTLLRASVKYGRAIAHVAAMYQHLRRVGEGRSWEVEISVDETESPTTHAEHVYIASELRRLGVEWVSLAPRYVGRFEKGVDYIGDLAEFEADFAAHAAIARHFGPYKLSLHSGSDKLSVYGIAVRQSRGMIHLKTAGTSYLEALRTLAALDPSFVREIYAFARDRYETDRASYHVSASLDRAPLPDEVSDADVPSLFDQFDSREILHVTFGSVLTERNAGGDLRFYERLIATLREHPDEYAARLEAHFVRHLAPWT